MDLGKTATALMGTLLIAFCLVTAVYYLLPLYQKIQLDQVCRDYMYQVNASEGLSSDLRLALEAELEEAGLASVAINGPAAGTLKRREKQVFKVEGLLTLRLASGFLTFEDRGVVYEFEGWVYGKRIIN